MLTAVAAAGEGLSPPLSAETPTHSCINTHTHTLTRRGNIYMYMHAVCIG